MEFWLAWPFAGVVQEPTAAVSWCVQWPHPTMSCNCVPTVGNDKFAGWLKCTVLINSHSTAEFNTYVMYLGPCARSEELIDEIPWSLDLQNTGGRWRVTGIVLNNHCQRLLSTPLDSGDLEFTTMTCSLYNIPLLVSPTSERVYLSVRVTFWSEAAILLNLAATFHLQASWGK